VPEYTGYTAVMGDKEGDKRCDEQEDSKGTYAK
jgi:hypothetical protein